MAFLFTKFRIQNKLKNKEVIVLKRQIKQYFKRRIDKYLINENGSKETVDKLKDEFIEMIHQEIDKVFKEQNNIKEDLNNEQERTD